MEFIKTAADLKLLGQKRLTAVEKKKRMRALDAMGVPNFDGFLVKPGLCISRSYTRLFMAPC
jgi:hypothetical protein